MAAGPRRNWEHFTGAKLLAWTGGFAAFLGAAFFIKYSFEHDLIPAGVRVALGYLFGLLLIGGGLKIPRPRYTATAHTLCATGIVCLYAVTFACNSIYHFEFFGPIPTFLLMALITGGAFLLAVRLGAQVVAVLGMLGGFLTPVLLSSGRDNAVGLFSYIALLDVGLVALALHQRWLFLVPLGAAGTVAMQLGWASHYLSAARTPTAMVVCLVFCGVFLAAHLVSRKLGRTAPQLRWSALALAGVALLFALGFIGYGTIAAQPALLFGFVLAADACLLALAWFDDASPRAHLIGGFGAFALLAIWTATRLTDDLLPWALGLYLIFGTMHTAFPLLLERRRPGVALPGWSQCFPLLALALVLIPVLRFDTVPLLLWPCVLLLDVLAIGLALFIGSVAAVGVALILTLTAAGLWLFRLPPSLPADPWQFLAVIGGFAVLFFAAGGFLARRLPATPAMPGRGLGDPRAQLPAFSALMPFLLMVMVAQRLPDTNPHALFGLALLLVLLGLGLTRVLAVAWLPACSLAGVTVLAYTWHGSHGAPGQAGILLGWIGVFYAVFTVFPFGFRRRFETDTGPWAVAALAGIVLFPLVYRLIDRVAANDVMGLVPAAFAIAPLVSFAALYRSPAADDGARLNQLAWFGGTALFFLTLIIPIQFERQWITLGWALEGVALLALFRRVTHTGLRATGVVLLTAAFVRLAFNPAVLNYQVRSGTPIFNWYLYTYGVAIACLFLGAVLSPPPDNRSLGVRLPPLLNSLGAVLAFLLLNIEIADFFQTPGTRTLTFQFSGNFARDMTYTIAWALFALGLLLISIWRRTRAGRFAALALLAVAVLKLFVHDLERLDALHRIGALFAVAIIAIVASLAYQRFLPGDEPAAKR